MSQLSDLVGVVKNHTENEDQAASLLNDLFHALDWYDYTDLNHDELVKTFGL
jgi:hypothetical protein